MPVTAPCPDCGLRQHRDNARCIKCGSALYNSTAPLPLPALSGDARRALGLGFFLALVLWLVPLTEILFHPLITIVHELGHAVTSWMFGYPAIPAFDFGEGGGVTSMLERVPLLLVIPYSLLAALAYRVRRHVPTLVVLAVVTAIYTRLAVTDRHNLAIVAMGHGGELVFIMIFLHRAMSGTALLQADERPAYAMAGFLIWLHDAQFAWRLMHDPETQAWYGEGKSGMSNDFTVINEEYIHVGVPVIATFFLAALAATVVIPLLLYRHESHIARWYMSAVGSDSEATS